MPVPHAPAAASRSQHGGAPPPFPRPCHALFQQTAGPSRTAAQVLACEVSRPGVRKVAYANTRYTSRVCDTVDFSLHPAAACTSLPLRQAGTEQTLVRGARWSLLPPGPRISHPSSHCCNAQIVDSDVAGGGSHRIQAFCINYPGSPRLSRSSRSCPGITPGRMAVPDFFSVHSGRSLVTLHPPTYLTYLVPRLCRYLKYLHRCWRTDGGHAHETPNPKLTGHRDHGPHGRGPWISPSGP